MDTMYERAAPIGLPGDEKFPAERIGAPVRGRGWLRSQRGAVVWAVVACVLAASAVAFGGAVPTSYIYGIDDNSQLWEMALTGTSAGTARLLGGSTITGSSANALAYDSVREQLFGVDTATDDIYWWQQGSTNYTVLGSLAGFRPSVGEAVSAAYYDDAFWFLGNGATGNLITKMAVTYAGGVPTAISGTTFTIGGMSTAASGGGDMVITSSGTLYAYSAPTLGNFFTADLASIVSGTVGGYSIISTSTGTGLQLALGVDNATLYGHEFATGQWYTVDTSNGSTTEVSGFTTVGFRDLGGSSIQAVPEPDTLVLAALGGGIAAWQATRGRKRRGRSPDGSPESPDQSPPDDLEDVS